MPDDEQVMAQVREGRSEMLAILFERHHVRLFNFFLRISTSWNLTAESYSKKIGTDNQRKSRAYRLSLT